MKLSNLRQIRPEDFPKEDQQTIEILGGILNEFMRQVIDLNNGRLSFENRVEVIKQIRVKVDANGKPTGNAVINSGKADFKGITVINAINVSNPNVFPTQYPFISAQKKTDNQVLMRNITGLQAGAEYVLTVVIY